MAGTGVPPPGVPQFQWPDTYTTLANWFWDPISSAVASWDDKIAGQLSTAPHTTIVSLGGTPHKIGHRDIPSEIAGWLNALDSNIAQWGDWMTVDPRQTLDQELAQVANNELYNVDGTQGDVGTILNLFAGTFSRNAIEQKLGNLGIPTDQINQVVNALYERPIIHPGDPQAQFINGGITQDWYGPLLPKFVGNQPGGPNQDPLLNDPKWGALAQLISGSGLNYGLNYGLQPDQEFSTVGKIDDAALLAALQAAGITPAATGGTGGTTTEPVATGTPLPATFNTQEAAMADNASGVSPTALNPWASFLYELAGKHLKGFDAKGNPVFETATTPGILGDQQKADIAAYLKPLGLNSTETYGRGLLDPTTLGTNLNRALGVFDTTILPGMTDLANEGFRTPTPDLYGGDQYAKARGAMNGRLFDPYQEQAAQGFLNDPLYAPFQQNAATGLLNDPVYRNQNRALASEMMSKGIPQATRDAAYRDFNQHAGQDLRASLGGQTGSFSSDYLGALARGSADITNQLARESAAYQAQGLGISNQMDASQRGAEETALGILNQMSQGTREAKSQGLQLLNQMDASERDAMMQALGVTNTMTQTQGALDSSLNESAAARRAAGLPMLASTTTARAQLPLTFGQDVINAGAANRLTDESLRPGSRTLNTLLQLTGGSAPGNLGYVAQGQLPSATTSLATGFTPFSAAFGQQQGGGSFLGNLLGNANFQNLAGGLLSKGLGALGGLFSDGFSSLFGGGGGSAQTATGGYYSNPSQPTYIYPNNGSSWGPSWL